MMRTLLVTSLLLLMISACEGGSDGATATPAEGGALGVTPLLPDPTPTLSPGLAQATGVPFPTPGPSATPTPTPSPSATPLPAERIELGQTRLSEQDYEAAAEHFETGLSVPGALDQEQQQSALLGLGLAYLREARFVEAADALRSYLALGDRAGSRPEISAPESEKGRRAMAYFHLGQAYRGAGQCPAAIEAYRTYLSADADLAAYVQPLIAECHLRLGDSAAAVEAYKAATQVPSHPSQEIDTRQALAGLHVEQNEYDQAIAQYDAILQMADDEELQGQMTYLAGSAAMLAGDQPAAFEWYLRGVQDYPSSSGAYQGLVQLVDAGVTVDLFQRGLVDYYAEAYEPAVAALEAYLQVQTGDYRPDVHLYLGRSYAALGNLEPALAQLDAYARFGADEEGAPHAAEAGVERGRLLVQAGRLEDAITAYLNLVEAEPGSEEAQLAAWWAAVLAVRLGDEPRAQALYRQFAQLFPGHEDAPQALFRAGFLAWRNEDQPTAVEIWRQLTAAYADSEFGAAGLIWLMRTLPESEAEPVVVTATNVSGAGYYQLRAREVALEEEPFREPDALNLEASEPAELAEAEAWLAEQLQSEEEVSGELTPELADDGRLIRGEKLWQLGLSEAAKRELEALRVENAGDALTSFRLALFFRDLGLYRSSILAAEALLRLAGQSAFQAPRLIGRLAYPTYYAELILPLAGEYGYDPLLQFSLVRQESLFESFIASYAGAQGLSQVMPATGQDIAQRLGWEDFTTEDLHRPHVGLAFGAYYLSQQLKAFDGDEYAALSAYNAGPGNAARWHAQAPDDPDLYLETVDYPETRLYIRRIYTGYAVYRHLYDAE